MRVSPHISWQVYDNRVYILDERKKGIFSFEDVSTEIFQFVIQGKKQDEIVSSLYQKYGTQVSFEIIKDDVIEFIDTMKKKELIQE